MESVEDFVRNLWHDYLEIRNYEKMLSFVDPSVTVIGTGKEEFHYSKASFQKQTESMIKWNGKFVIEREWYQSIPMTDEYCLVVGEVFAKEAAENCIAAVLDLRISMVCRKEGGQWKVFHSHHSVPNTYQKKGEFFPKSITEQSNMLLRAEIAKKTMELEEITQQAIYNSRCDQMTGLLNRVSTEGDIETCLKENRKGTLFMIDVDNFKQVNDCAGHLIGDRLLIRIAGKLRRVFGTQAVIGRMGGDEFVVYLKGEVSEEEASQKAQLLLNFVQSEKIVEFKSTVTLSIGIASAPENGCSFESLWANADKALYSVKNEKKNSYSFYQGS